MGSVDQRGKDNHLERNNKTEMCEVLCFVKKGKRAGEARSLRILELDRYK